MKRQICISIAGVFVFVFTLNAQIKIISNGNVGVGTDNPLQKLHVNGAIRGNQQAGALDITTDNGYTRIGAQNSTCTHFYTSLPMFYFGQKINIGDGNITSYTGCNLTLCTSSGFTPRVTILQSNGYVGIGTTSPSYMLDVNGYVRATNISVSSDIRLKKDVADLASSSVNNLYNLKAITFKPIQRADIVNADNRLNALNDTSMAVQTAVATPERTMVGFSAQDVQKIFPELVNADEQGYLSVDYISLIPVLVEAIKTQQARIAELEKKVAVLSGTKPR